MSTKKTVVITVVVTIGVLAVLLSLHLIINGIDLPHLLRSLHGG